MTEEQKHLITMMEKAKACIEAGDQDGAVKFALMAAKLSTGGNENAMMQMMDGAKQKALESRDEAMKKGAGSIEEASEEAAIQTKSEMAEAKKD